MEDPCISLIQETITNETNELLPSEDDISTDLTASSQEKRKEFSSKLTQYCVAKQAAPKFQVTPNSRGFIITGTFL